MLNAIKKLFGINPSDAAVPVEPAAPYKIDPLPAGTEAAIITTPNTVVVVADVVVPAEVVKAAPAKRGPAKPKAVKPAVVKAPAAPKKPRATKSV